MISESYQIQHEIISFDDIVLVYQEYDSIKAYYVTLLHEKISRLIPEHSYQILRYKIVNTSNVI